MNMQSMTDEQIVAKRSRLSCAPWAGGYGHYAVIDKARWHWEDVCHVSASDEEFVVSFRRAVGALKEQARVWNLIDKLTTNG